MRAKHDLRRNLVLLASLVLSCSDNTSSDMCVSDEQCEAGGALCHAGECVLATRLDCVEGSTEVAKFLVSTEAIEFGIVGASSITRELSIENAGECTLRISLARFGAGSASRFSCDACKESALPIRIPPGRTTVVELAVSPGPPGALVDTLELGSNDAERPTVVVALNAQSGGIPALTLVPDRIDLGFVPAGDTREVTVQALNLASGSTSLPVMSAELGGPDRASFSASASPALPTSLESAREDPTARIAFTIRFAPTAVADHEAELVVTPALGDVKRVALVSSSAPPRSSITPDRIEFGSLRLGRRLVRAITIQNTGANPLVATANLQSGTNPDLSLPRALPRSIAPGGVHELSVVYAPTRSGPATDSLLIETNDPMARTLSIPLNGTGEASGRQVVAVELSFENSSDSPLDSDLRDVDLFLESPVGLVCDERNPQPAWGTRGSPLWSSSPPKENPERIVLADAEEDGRYSVSLSYVEDCASLPTALAASLLGVGTEALVDYLSDGEVPLDPEEVSAVIEDLCVQRRAADATLRITVDGLPVGERRVRLSEKGQLAEAFQLVLVNGRYSVE